MANSWINFIKAWAKTHKVTYKEAIANTKAKMDYANTKKLTKKPSVSKQSTVPKQSKGSTSTSTDVHSPTSTSTSTKADTRGNVTVTGGAGKGATTSVTINKK
jgi:hypothetical protein